MKLISSQEIVFESEIRDEEHEFRMGYCRALECFVMAIRVHWVCDYWRFFHLTQEGYELYRDNPDEFLALHFPVGKRFQLTEYVAYVMGASILFEYRCTPKLPFDLPHNGAHAWRGYVYHKGYLWAYFETQETGLIIPPRQLHMEEYPEITPIQLGKENSALVAHGCWVPKIR